MLDSGVAAASQTTTSPGVYSQNEKQVIKALSGIVPPGESADVVSSGVLTQVFEKDGVVTVQLQLHPKYRDIKRSIESMLTSWIGKPETPWMRSVRVVLASPSTPNELAKFTTASKSTTGAANTHVTPPGAVGPRGLVNVRNIIAVSSGKGGVGKSTVAVNLAYALSQLETADGVEAGGSPRPVRVGLLDTDLYGPSLPTMVSPREVKLKEYVTDTNDSLIEPLEYSGVKLMSYGWVPSSRVKDPTGNQSGSSGASTAALIRGPLASQLVAELATRTHWGDLDYLVIDMPPGTGDIHLTLAQTLKITAAVIVTIPSKLSFVDVVKGIDMFDQTGVPVLGVVENMAYFECPDTRRRHHIFGDSTRFRHKLAKDWGIDKFYQLPMLPEIAQQSDSGDPFILRARDADQRAQHTNASKPAPTTTISTNANASPSKQASSTFSIPFASKHLKSTSSVQERTEESSPIANPNSSPPTPQSTEADEYAEIRKNAQKVYDDIAQYVLEMTSPVNRRNLTRQVYSAKYSADSNQILIFDTTEVTQATSSSAGKLIRKIPARELRLACKCAGCVHEITGRPILKPHMVPESVRPVGMIPRGQYALSVIWSDGHQSSMYPWSQLTGLGESVSQ